MASVYWLGEPARGCRHGKAVLRRDLLGRHSGVFSVDATLRASDIFARVKDLGLWKDETIWQYMMALTADLSPARHHWQNARPFLFLCPDGRYQIYDDRKHPPVVD